MIAVSVAISTLALASSAAATTVFSEGLETPFPTAQFSKADGQQEASQFQLGANTAITGATFYGASYYGGPLPSIYTIQFFSKGIDNMPLAELFSVNVSGSSVSTGIHDNTGSTVYAITSSFAPFTALAGVNYFFSASDVAGKAYNFLVETSGTGVGRQTSGGLGHYYAIRTGEAFSLSDTAAAPHGVPEPASWALMLLGFGSVGAVLRRRHRGQVVLTA